MYRTGEAWRPVGVNMLCKTHTDAHGSNVLYVWTMGSSTFIAPSLPALYLRSSDLDLIFTTSQTFSKQKNTQQQKQQHNVQGTL